MTYEVLRDSWARSRYDRCLDAMLTTRAKEMP